MKWGFTGSRKGAPEEFLRRTLHLLLKKGDWVITGACEGIDSQIVHIVEEEFPSVRQIVIVPANRRRIDPSVIDIADVVIEMPRGTDYRDRNKRVVKESDGIAAFWTGRRAHSGTYMTINIARRKGKLRRIYKVVGG